MGCVFDELVPVAILLDNPGLTKYEFITKMASVHSGGGEANDSVSWHEKGSVNRYHYGIDGLARILGLRQRPDYLAFIKGTVDAEGRHLRSPFLQKVDMEHEQFEVGIHTGYRLGTPRPLRFKAVYPYYEGDRLVGFSDGVYFENVKNEKTLVDSVISKIVKQEFDDPFYHYDVRVRSIRKIIETEHYASIESLLSQWPQFHPEYRWDFSQQKGIFDIDLGDGSFRWFMDEGKYYVDPISFDLMHAGSSLLTCSRDNFGFSDRKYEYEGVWGYTDLILTAEAIKHEAWKLLSYRGNLHAALFLRDFPTSQKRVEKAIWDSHSSLAAKKRQMTTTELLRMQLVGGIN